MDTQLIKIFENNYALRIKFESEGESTAEGSGLHACFVLDRSGSMAGGPIRDAKGALVSFVTKMEKMNVPVSIIAFNNMLEKASSVTHGYDGLRTWVEAIKGSGGTLFRNVFEEMETRFIKDHLDNTFIMFLSDGQDNDGLAKLIPYMERFKAAIVKNNFTASIHTIGFSEDHDAKLLTALTTYGTKAGTFQYLDRDGRIPVAVNNATEFLYQTSIWGQYIGANGVPIKLEISDDEKNSKIHYGVVFLDEKEIGEAKVELFASGKKTEHKLELNRVDNLELEDRVMLFTSFASNTVLKILEQRQHKLIKKEDIPGLMDKIHKIDKGLDDLIAAIKKFRSLQRKQNMPFCLQAKDMIREFYDVLKEDVSQEISNIKLAQLNRLAYSNILTRSLMKKINKRIGENAGMLQEIDNEINKILTAMDFKMLGEKYKDDTEKYGHCLISYKDWFDALQDGDCFCLTFDAARAEGGIMDPSLVTIKSINTTQLTAESFLDSALFITRSGQLIKGVGQHGAPASTLVKGLPEEIITGILPLYINEDNWKVAKLRMKPLLAWTIAQDVLAYEPKQMTVLPFVLMAKAAISQNTEHKKFQFKLIADTCAAIYRDNKEMILPDLKVKLDSYLAKPDVRTVDQIPNNRVFLCHLYVALKEGDIKLEQILPILPHIMEEELRRNGPKVDLDIHEFYMKILNVDIAKYVTPYITAFRAELDSKKGTTSQAEKFKALVKDMHIELKAPEEVKGIGKEEEKAPVKPAPVSESEVKFEFDTTVLCERAEKVVQRYNDQFKNAEWNVPQTVALLNLFDVKPYGNIEEMGLDTAAKKLAFCIQSSIQKANADRRDAIAKGLYISPFDHAASENFIKKLYAEQAILERNNQKSKVLAEIEKNAGFEDAAKFAQTKDIYDAAGILHGTLRGSAMFHHFHQALRSPGIPLIVEKCKMLTSGQYLGVKLIMDDMKSPQDVVNGFVVWRPKKKHCFKIWEPNRAQAPLEEWQKAFPTLVEYLKDQDDRKNGIFVPYRHPRANVKDPRHRVNSPMHTGPAKVSKKKKVKKQKPAKKP